MHPTIETIQQVVAKGDAEAIATVLAEDVRFMPPTYWATWTGRDAGAAVLGHVGQVFSDFLWRVNLSETPATIRMRFYVAASVTLSS